MIRRVRGLIVSLAFLLVMVGALLTLRLVKSGKSDETVEGKTATVELTNLDVDKIESVKIQTAESEIRFRQESGTSESSSGSDDGDDKKNDQKTWIVEDAPEHFRPAQEPINTAIREFATISSADVVMSEASEEKIDEFGLKTPDARITLTDIDGKKVVMEIGRDSPSGSWRYARKAVSTTVVQIANYVAERAFQNRDDYRDMSLPTIDLNKLAGLSYRFVGKTVIVEPEKNGSAFRTTGSGLEITAPFRGRYSLRKERLDELLSNNPLPSQASRWLDDTDPADPRLKLDSRSADRLAVADADGNILSLFIGAQADSTTRYARFADHQDAIFTVDNDSLALIELQPFELVDRFVFLANISRTAQVKIEKDGTTWTMRRTEAGEEDNTQDDKYYLNDMEVFLKPFTDVYQDLISLSWEGIVRNDKPRGSSPEIRISFVNNDPTVRNAVVRLWPYDDVYYQGSVNGQSVEFLVGRYQVDDFFDALTALGEATL